MPLKKKRITSKQQIAELEAALKKQKPAPVVVLSRIVTKQNSISTPDYLGVGLHGVGE